jgi:hypothetical protein
LNLLNFGSKDFDDANLSSILQQEGVESSEELSKFWFEMYQRVKKEVSKERKNNLELQSRLQSTDEEIY